MGQPDRRAHREKRRRRRYGLGSQRNFPSGSGFETGKARSLILLIVPSMPLALVASVIGAILVLCPISGVLAQSGAGRPPRSGWYLDGSIGSNWASDMDQESWNRDPLCYPTDACFDADPVPEIPGYRWRYDIDATAGAEFELSAGRIFDRTRLELSLGQRLRSAEGRLLRHRPPARG